MALTTYLTATLSETYGNRWLGGAVPLSEKGAAEVFGLTAAGKNSEAVKRYCDLTGAEPQEAKAYVDSLEPHTP